MRLLYRVLAWIVYRAANLLSAVHAIVGKATNWTLDSNTGVWERWATRTLRLYNWLYRRGHDD